MSSVETLRPLDEPHPEGSIWTKLPDEEWANGLTHAVGWLLGMIGSIALLYFAIPRGTYWQIASCVVYALTLLTVYTASTLSHWVWSPVWRARFRAWDQGTIYLFIAGNFTPFAAAAFTGWWHLLTVLMWTLAISGFLSKVAFHHRVNGIALWLYLGLGWLSACGMPVLISSGYVASFQFALAGGIAYTVGSVLLINDHRAGYLHVGWHAFVMLGTVLHYFAVWYSISPAGS